MPKNTPSSNTPPEAVISIIGAGMNMVGDSETNGSLRIEGTIRGSVRAGKSVVVGKDGFVDGSVFTQDAVIAGRVSGGIHAESRLELQATSEVSGEIVAPRMQVEEGAKVQGQVAVGETPFKGPSKDEAAKPQRVGGAEKVEGQTEPARAGSGGKAGRQTEPEQASVGGKGGRQAEPERPGGGGKAERKTESERPSGARQAEPETRPLGGGGRVVHKSG